MLRRLHLHRLSGRGFRMAPDVDDLDTQFFDDGLVYLGLLQWNNWSCRHCDILYRRGLEDILVENR